MPNKSICALHIFEKCKINSVPQLSCWRRGNCCAHLLNYLFQMGKNRKTFHVTVTYRVGGSLVATPTLTSSCSRFDSSISHSVRMSGKTELCIIIDVVCFLSMSSAFLSNASLFNHQSIYCTVQFNKKYIP